MTLAEFKKLHGIDTLSFFKSKKTSRFVAPFGGNKILITKEVFDRTKPCFVYDHPKAVGTSFVLSNTEAVAEFTM